MDSRSIDRVATALATDDSLTLKGSGLMAQGSSSPIVPEP
jgi:hypothetical protein